MSPGVLEFPISEISEIANSENPKTENLDFDFDSADYDLTDEGNDPEPHEIATWLSGPVEPELSPGAPAAPQSGPAPESAPTTVPEASNAAGETPEATAVESVPTSESTPTLESVPAPDATVPGSPFAVPDFTASLSIPTKGQVLRTRIRDLERSILITDREEHSLAERLSSTRKERKELLGLLQSAEQRLKFLAEEGTEDDPDESETAVANVAGNVTGTGSGNGNDSPSVSTIVRAAVASLSAHYESQSASSPSTFTGDPGATATLSVLGANESQMDKFGEADIRTVCDFEKALTNRSIEKVRGIQERTMDKLKDRLIEWRNKHGYGVSGEATETTATETEATAETATETAVESTTEPVTQPAWVQLAEHIDSITPPDEGQYTGLQLLTARAAGHAAALAGKLCSELSSDTDPVVRKHWEDGWQEGFAKIEAQRKKASAELAADEAPEQPKKRGRKPKPADATP